MNSVPTPQFYDGKSRRNRDFNNAVFENQLKPGAVILWPTTTAPEGFASLDHQAISRLTFYEVFALIGTAHGSGDGSTTFNVPNWNSSFPPPTGAIWIMKL